MNITNQRAFDKTDLPTLHLVNRLDEAALLAGSPLWMRKLCMEAATELWQALAELAYHDSFLATGRPLFQLIDGRIDRERAKLDPYTVPRKLEDYHEDMGDVLWWRFPVDEAPYAGSPLDTAWPGYHTHFTQIPMPLAIFAAPEVSAE